MGVIKIHTKSNASAAALYDTAHRTEDFVHAMPNVDEIRTLEKSPDGAPVKAKWNLSLPFPGDFARVTWIKSITWDDSSKICSFKLSPDYQGHIKKLDAKWTFKDASAGAEMNMTMDFKVAHPLVNPIMHMMFDKLMKKNIEALFKEISKNAPR